LTFRRCRQNVNGKQKTRKPKREDGKEQNYQIDNSIKVTALIAVTLIEFYLFFFYLLISSPSSIKEKTTH
jgi:hypothetical protein